jgi:hypothetical protein
MWPPAPGDSVAPNADAYKARGSIPGAREPSGRWACGGAGAHRLPRGAAAGRAPRATTNVSQLVDSGVVRCLPSSSRPAALARIGPRSWRQPQQPPACPPPLIRMSSPDTQQYDAETKPEPPKRTTTDSSDEYSQLEGSRSTKMHDLEALRCVALGCGGVRPGCGNSKGSPGVRFAHRTAFRAHPPACRPCPAGAPSVR